AAQRAIPIEADDDFGTLSAKAAELAVELLDEALPEPSFEPQPDEGATYAEKIGPADRELDRSRPAAELRNRSRDLSTHIGTRPGTGARAGVRTDSARADARPRERGARPAPRAEARSAGAGGPAPRRLPARVLRRGRSCRSQRVGRACPRGRACPSGGLHQRRSAPAFAWTARSGR